MFNRLIEHMQLNKDKWKKVSNSFIERKIPPKTVLLEEGDIANQVFFIKEGCLRQWFNKDGKDITFQFFFENQPVASIDSFVNDEPSLFNIESIEHSTIISLSKNDFQKIFIEFSELKDQYHEFIFQRLRNYSYLFLSRIKDTPQERYEELIKTHPEIIQRIPQHYIASYLGITPISLSRIRNRK